MGTLLPATEKGRRVARPRTAGFGVRDVASSDILTPRMLGGEQKREYRVNPSLSTRQSEVWERNGEVGPSCKTAWGRPSCPLRPALRLPCAGASRQGPHWAVFPRKPVASSKPSCYWMMRAVPSFQAKDVFQRTKRKVRNISMCTPA